MGKQDLIIFDTTLRDGEQSPGVDLSTNQKLIIASELSHLGAHVIEAGFPASSPAEFKAVQAISRAATGWSSERLDFVPPVICGFARCVPADIVACYDAIEDAPLKRMHLTIATSDIHLEYKLKITREQCLERVIRSVQQCKALCDDIEFGAEDSSRSDPDFLCAVFSEAIAHGATTLNFTDTVGNELPETFKEKLQRTMAGTKGGENVIWSVHCHNDLGLSTANTLAGIVAGARQAEVTINGIGERAGNAALEEVVMAIRTHPGSFPANVDSIDTQRLTRLSRLVSNFTGMVVQPNKAIVGSNAFVHESGIHQDGIIKNKLTYEVISPMSVGAKTRLPIGKHCGRAGFRNHLISELGLVHLDEAEIEEAYLRYKNLNNQDPDR